MPKKGKKILVVEDDQFLVKIISNRLKEEGFDVEISHDGEDALGKIIKTHFSLVMLDLIMPKKTGFEVLQEMKAKKIKTPVVIFSNLSQEDDKNEVLKLGAKGYYVKSDISIDEMVASIKKFIA